MIWAQAAVVAWLVGIHLFAARAWFWPEIPRNKWLSFAGGTSTAYVFLHILPEVEKAQQTMSEHLDLPFADLYAYLIAMFGLIVFYGLERFVNTVRKHEDSGEQHPATGPGNGVFWVHIASFTVYNALIGYLLVADVGKDPYGLVLFAVAFGMHFVVNDFGLRAQHKAMYHNVGRWVVAAAIFLGWCAGQVWRLNEIVVGGLFAILAGSIILNVLKEELPESRESRFLPFAVGAAGYSFILLLI